MQGLQVLFRVVDRGSGTRRWGTSSVEVGRWVWGAAPGVTAEQLSGGLLRSSWAGSCCCTMVRWPIGQGGDLPDHHRPGCDALASPGSSRHRDLAAQPGHRSCLPDGEPSRRPLPHPRDAGRPSIAPRSRRGLGAACTREQTT